MIVFKENLCKNLVKENYLINLHNSGYTCNRNVGNMNIQYLNWSLK
jgi:hypothetical protein